MAYTLEGLAYARSWREANKDRVNAQARERRRAQADKLNELERVRHQADPRRSLWESAKKRTTHKGLPFDIVIDDIQVPHTCPVFGFPLVVGAGKLTNSSPSLDRKDPSLGYTNGNIWVISYKANRAKNDCTLEELKALVSAIEANK